MKLRIEVIKELVELKSLIQDVTTSKWQKKLKLKGNNY